MKWFIPLVEAYLYRPLIKRLSGDFREELEGLSQGAEVDLKQIFRAVLAPDIMQLLISGFLRGGKKGNGNYYLGGCSAAYCRGKALKNGQSSLLARNLDFPGALVWKFPALIYNYPTEKIEVPHRSESGSWHMEEKIKQPYMYVSTAGFPGTGLTGYNQSGISMSTFVCLSRESSVREPPSLDYNHRLFTALEDLDSLPYLLEMTGKKCAAPHTVLFADRKQARVLEVSSRSSFLREIHEGFDTIVQTNHYLSPQLKKGEVEFVMERENSIERFRFLRDAMELYHGRLDSRRMVDIISSMFNRFTGKTALTGFPSPAQPDTLMSLVLDHESGDFWLAGGKPPGICLNRYRGFNAFSGKAVHDIKRSERSVFDPSVHSDPGPGARESLVYFMLAKEQLKTGNKGRAVKLLRQAWDSYEDPGYLYILAILLLRCNHPEKALSLFLSLKERFSLTPIKDSVIPLWEGRCHDLSGRRDEALWCYKRGLRIPGLIRDYASAYKRGLRIPFTMAQMPPTVNFNNPGPVIS